jgi:hypothetical protein
LCVTPALAESQKSPLTTVRVLEYLDFSGKPYHRIVRKVLVNNIAYVVEQMSTSSTNKDFAYLANIEARDTGEPIYNPKQDPQRYWSDKDMPALAVLYGEVGDVERADSDGKTLVAASSIYIGDLPSQANSLYGANTFRVPLELKLKSFNELADSHSFIVAYALLLDAVRRDAPKHVQAALVNACSQIFDRLESNLYQTSELSEVAKAVEAISKLLRGP